MLQTICAIVLAANSGISHVGLVVEASRDFQDQRAEWLAVPNDLSAAEASRQWRPYPLPREDDLRGPCDDGGTVSFAALELPAFQVTSGDSRSLIADPAAFPLCCTIVFTDDEPQLLLEASNDLLDEDELVSLAGQFNDVSSTLAQRQGATVSEVIQAAQSLRYEIGVAAESGFELLAGTLESWGRHIGLPVQARRLEPGQALAASYHAEITKPRPRGANVLLARAAWAAVPALAVDADRLLAQFARRMRVAALPDGSPIAELNNNETRELFDEIFIRRQYLRHGIRVPDGAVVVDAGANIGLFTLFAHGQARGVQVHAFEPVPLLSEILAANRHLYNVTGHVVQAALSNRDADEPITFYPRSSLQSGLHATPEADKEVARTYASNQAAHLALAADAAAHMPEQDSFLEVLEGRFGSEQHTVRVMRLSSWIRETGIDRIDLLKVDVERAELELLEGIAPEHWPIIQQAVIEVHDIGRRVTQVSAFLREHGFTVTCEQDALFAGSEVFMLYARRGAEAKPGLGHLLPAAALWADAAARWAIESPVPVYIAASPDTSADDDSWTALLQGIAATVPGVTHVDLYDGRHELEREGTRASGHAWHDAGTRLMRRITTTERPVTKAIVVDADNTLWGGTCGEAGPENVDTRSPYRDVQEFLRAQRAAGRALCLCTRNNRADIDAVFTLHPEMPLKLDDFSVIHAGWEAKSVGVAAISEQLEYAISTLVYVDDSPAERAEVALAHPDLTVVSMPNDPHKFARCLRATWQLDICEQTAEDRQRARSVQAEAHRRALATSAATFGDFIAELGLQVTVTPSTEPEISRISQLARRTSQFNLLLRHHTDATVRHLIADGTAALSVRVSDRFGDYGLVGFVAAQRSGSDLRVEDWFISCRALGRNVEWRILQALAEYGNAVGAQRIVLTAVPGPRNAPALSFLRDVRRRCTDSSSLDEYTVAATTEAVLSLDWRAPIGAPAHQDPELGTRFASPAPRYRWPAPQADSAPLGGAVTSSITAKRPVMAYVSPRTDREVALVRAWQSVLRIDDIGTHDNLFALGGDSLAAVAICAQLRITHGISVGVGTILETPTIAGIAAVLTRADGAHRPAPPTSAPSTEASHGQRRLWAADKISEHPNAQTIPLAYRIRGPFDLKRLETAIANTIDRHPSLRTKLAMHEGSLVRQESSAPFLLRTGDLAGIPHHRREAAAEAAAAQFFSKLFTAESDLMLRGLAVRLSSADTLLLLLVHHTAADGWSIGILNRGISHFYANRPVPDPPAGTTFADYATQTKARERAGDFDAGLASVTSALRPFLGARGAPSRNTPGARMLSKPTHLRFGLSHILLERVRTLAREYSTTPFTVHLAALQLLLAIAGGKDVIVTGCPIDNRIDPAFDDTVGFFANLVAFPASFRWDAPVADYLRSASMTAFSARKHADIPFGMVVNALNADLTVTPGTLFDAVFTLQPPASHPLALDGCDVSQAEPAVWPQPFPLMLDVEDHGQEPHALLRYDDAVPLPAAPEWIATTYPLALTAFWRLPHRTLRFIRATLNSETTVTPEPRRAQHTRRQGLQALRDLGGPL